MFFSCLMAFISLSTSNIYFFFHVICLPHHCLDLTSVFFSCYMPFMSLSRSNPCFSFLPQHCRANAANKDSGSETALVPQTTPVDARGELSVIRHPAAAAARQCVPAYRARFLKTRSYFIIHVCIFFVNYY